VQGSEGGRDKTKEIKNWHQKMLPGASAVARGAFEENGNVIRRENAEKGRGAMMDET